MNRYAWIKGRVLFENAWGALVENGGTFYVFGHHNGLRLLHQSEDDQAAWAAFDRWEKKAKKNGD